MVGILIGVLLLLLVVVLVAVLAAGAVRLHKFALNTLEISIFVFIQEGTRIQTPNRYSLPFSRLHRKVNLVKIFTFFPSFEQLYAGKHLSLDRDIVSIEGIMQKLEQLDAEKYLSYLTINAFICFKNIKYLIMNFS